MTNKQFPVVIEKITPTSNPEIMRVTFSQENEKRALNSFNVTQLFMKGVEAFDKYATSGFKKHFRSVSVHQIEALGLVEGGFLPEELNAQLVIVEHLVGEKITPEYSALMDKNPKVFQPRVFVNAKGETQVQDAKRKGKDGEYLTVNGQKIYRDVYLSIGNMVKEDKLIQHDEVVAKTTANAGVESILGTVENSTTPF